MEYITVVPTYNERKNLERLVVKILRIVPDMNILIVDDNSPDGTGELADELAKKDSRIRVLHREKKEGLGEAYKNAFKYVLKNFDANYILQMDADLSHRPKDLMLLLNKRKDYDLIIGSRRVKKVKWINRSSWPLRRVLLSELGTSYTKFFTGMPFDDATSGFKCFKREVLENIDWDKVKSKEFAFQIEIIYNVWRSGFKIKEVPIIFVDRTHGMSKLSKGIMLEGFLLILRLFFKRIFDIKHSKALKN